ncbi:MAG: LLM class flavin-dependent oxidoreductase, partial [Nitrospinaceae bacterium]|nr:LLM class flavin-dependent oxidoreductase [Nitrospinaceae bacterium]
MKFSIAVNMNRFAESTSMVDVIQDTLDLVKMADEGG